MNTDSLIGDYMGRLEAAAAALPAGRRTELAAEVREHIDAALAEAGRSDEVTVRNILDRLGSPEEIVAAEAGSPALAGAAASAAATAATSAAAAPATTGPGTAATVPARWGPVEVLALLSLGLAWPALLVRDNGVLLWLGLGVVGLVLTWLSSVWSRRRKLATTSIVVAAYVVLILLVTPFAVQCSGSAGASQPCPPSGSSPIEVQVPAATG